MFLSPAIEAPRLPELRQNLKIMPGSADEYGAPSWLLYDGIRHRYFTLSEDAVMLLEQWQPGKTVEEFISHLDVAGIEFEAEEITAFIDFLTQNNLILARNEAFIQRFYEQHISGKKSFWVWLLHNYLFIKIPLFKPDKWFDRWLVKLDWLFSTKVAALLIVMGLFGTLMVIRRWDEFSATFLHFFTTEGLMFYGLTLLLVKSVHELGHGFSAKRRGCRVSSMGIAFMMMFPVLYTDTTDAWKLGHRSERLRIVTAGVRAELYLAMIATFLWSILPSGVLSSVAFFIATTSWVTSVLVNISPFMRFDGYYAFSDLIGIENLQQRSFAMGSWKLRKMLWGLNDPQPEPFTRNRANLLIGYAWCVWVYRFFLFLGIALMVYQMFFKVLGILLFVVEIIWFIGLPIIKELAVWKERRKEFNFTRRRIASYTAVFAVLVGFVMHIQEHVYLPAVAIADQKQTIYPPDAGILESLYARHGSEVSEGDILAILRSDELDFELEKVQQQIEQINIKLSRSASSIEEKNLQAVNKQQLLRLQEAEKGLLRRINNLVIKAPFSGLVNTAEPLHEGRWVNPDKALLTLSNNSELAVEGFVSEHQLSSLQKGHPGVFIPHQGGGIRLPVEIENITLGAVYSLPYPELGSTYSGEIAIRQGEDGRLIPEEAHYRVYMTVKGDIPEEFHYRMPGTVTVEGDSQNWLMYHLEYIVATLVRESGF